MDDLLTSYISLMLTSMNRKSLRRRWWVLLCTGVVPLYLFISSLLTDIDWST